MAQDFGTNHHNITLAGNVVTLGTLLSYTITLQTARSHSLLFFISFNLR